MTRYKDLCPGDKVRIDDEFEVEPGVWRWARSYAGTSLVHGDHHYFGFHPELEGKRWRRALNDPETCKHFWCGLWPSSSLGYHEHCYECETGRFIETGRCACEVKSYSHFPRTIYEGICDWCGLIVRGHEDEVHD